MGKEERNGLIFHKKLTVTKEAEVWILWHTEVKKRKQLILFSIEICNEFWNIFFCGLQICMQYAVKIFIFLAEKWG